MKATRKSYPIDFNDSQWELLKALISSLEKEAEKELQNLYISTTLIPQSKTLASIDLLTVVALAVPNGYN